MHLKPDNQIEILCSALNHKYRITINNIPIDRKDFYGIPVMLKELMTFKDDLKMTIVTPNNAVYHTNIKNGLKYLAYPDWGVKAYHALLHVPTRVLMDKLNYTRQNVSLLRVQSTDFAHFWRLRVSVQKLNILNELYSEHIGSTVGETLP